MVVFFGDHELHCNGCGLSHPDPVGWHVVCWLGKNPLIGMAAAFAGVSAGFSANLIPATPVDVILGANARIFAESQGSRLKRQAVRPLTRQRCIISLSSFRRSFWLVLVLG